MGLKESITFARIAVSPFTGVPLYPSGLNLSFCEGGVGMKHTSVVHFFPFFLGVLSIIAVNEGKAQKLTAHPNSPKSLLQHMRAGQNQQKQFGPSSAQSEPLFLEAPRYAVGMFPQSVVVADFNADNKLDLAVVNYCTDDACTQ